MATIDAVIARFETQLGVVETPFGSNHTPYNDWYFGRRTGAPWCATFLSWCFYHEGLPLPATIDRGFAYTPSGARWFKQEGRWTTRPAKGHVVFFDFPGDGVNRISHVGIVTNVGDGYIDTIEGNTDERGSRTGGKVMRRRRSVGIVGYGIPQYTVYRPEQLVQNEEEDVAYVIWRDTPAASDEGALLLGNGKVVVKHGSTLKAFEEAGAPVVMMAPEDYDAIPTIGNAFQ